MVERPIVGPLGIIRKTAPGQLPAAQVILQAIAADALAAARLIGTVAEVSIAVGFALHGRLVFMCDGPFIDAGAANARDGREQNGRDLPETRTFSPNPPIPMPSGRS
jgi:hypothetical protein